MASKNKNMGVQKGAADSVAKGTGKANGSSLALKALLATGGLMLAALAIIFFSGFLLPHVRPPRGGMPGMPDDLEDYMLLRFILSVINVVLVAYLLFVHVKDYLKLRSAFTLGLVAFLFSFLLYALSTLPAVHLLLGPFGRAAFLSFIPMLFSAIGLLVFVWLSNE